MSENPQGNGWQEWKRKVLSDLDRLNTRLDRTAEIITRLCTDTAGISDLRNDVHDLTDAVNELRREIAVIKTKLATYGAAGGAITGVLVAVVTALIMRALGL